MQDIIKWAGAIASLIACALSLGVHPALYGATADMLARGGRVVQRLSWLLSGLIFGAVLMFAILHLVNPTNYLSAIREHLDHAALNFWVDLSSGLVFLLLSAGICAWRLLQPTLKKQSAIQAPQRTFASAYFGIGFSSAIVGFTTWPLMYLVTRVINGVTHDIALRGTALLIFLLTLISPFLLLAWAWSRFPRTAQKITALYARALNFDYRWVAAALFAFAGTAFLVLALIRHG